MVAQRDVVDFFASSNAEEFYWNLTGTDWAQPFARVSGRVVLDDGLRSALLDQDACYRGYAGSTERCAITRSGDTFAVDELAIGPYQTVTIAIGFAPGTFTLFDTSYLATPWAWVQLLGVAIAVGAAGAALVLRLAQGRDLAAAFRAAVAAGTATAMTEATELCHRDDVERLEALLATRPTASTAQAR